MAFVWILLGFFIGFVIGFFTVCACQCHVDKIAAETGVIKLCGELYQVKKIEL